MSIWDLSDGGNAKDTGKEYEVPGGGNFDPIPDGSSVLAEIDEAKWTADTSGAEFLSLRWSVIDPQQFKNRKVFQKLWVKDFDPSAKDNEKASQKRDKARRMLAAIDANAGGKLVKMADDPTSNDLFVALSNRPMIVTLKIWEMPDRQNPGSVISGNWVCAVAPASEKKVEVGKAEPSKASGGGKSAMLDDDIPF